MSLAGRGAVVTGASRGIGLAIAHALAARGVRVALVARSAETLAARAAELGPAALPVPCDVADPDAVGRAARVITMSFGAPPDILVNNAGIFHPRPVTDTTPGEFAETMRVNLVGPFAFIHAVLAPMRERRHGHIVTIGSVADRTIFPENAAYSASKFGARALHEVLRAELRGSGVRVTLVSPGPTDTSIWDGIDRAGTGRFPPRSGMLRPDAVADAVMYALERPDGVNIDELRLSSA